MTDFRLTPLAASLPSTVPFVGPETQERARGGPFEARLGANENVFGPSPRAIKAMAEASLLPAVREAGPDALIIADGTSCRHQIKDGAGTRALHVAEVLEMTLR